MASEPLSFWPTFILDLANNHNGDFERAKEIIYAHALASTGYDVAIKFQLRDHDHYVHGEPEYRERFKQTWLPPGKYAALAAYAKQLGLRTMATAFDPASAKWLKDYDFAKVASRPEPDWETIEAVIAQNKPTIFSTGGQSRKDIRRVVRMAEDGLNPEIFDNRFALMHCVSLYPCPEEACNLQEIRRLRCEHPGVVVGWSTHEPPEATTPVQMAVAYGAEIFERHITISPVSNAFSALPVQTHGWIKAWEHATRVAGTGELGGREDERAVLGRMVRRDQGAVSPGGDRPGEGVEGGTQPSPRA